MAKVPTRRRHKATLDEEINLIPVMNLFMVLIPFLLLTAVFAKTAVIDIYLPKAADAKAEKTTTAKAPSAVLTIHVTATGFKFTGLGKGIADIKKQDGKYDFTTLSGKLVELKAKHPTKEEVILLFEPSTPYETVVKLMDTTRELIKKTDDEKSSRKILFPLVSVGQTDANKKKK